MTVVGECRDNFLSVPFPGFPPSPFLGCGFFACSWKLPAYSRAFLLSIDNFSFFTYNWSFFAHKFSFFTCSWGFFAYSGKVHLIRAFRDCKQRSLTVSKKLQLEVKKLPPCFMGSIPVTTTTWSKIFPKHCDINERRIAIQMGGVLQYKCEEYWSISLFWELSGTDSTAIQIGGVLQYKCEVYCSNAFLRSSGGWGVWRSSAFRCANTQPFLCYELCSFQAFLGKFSNLLGPLSRNFRQFQVILGDVRRI